jgi:hypothetical protein
VLIAIDGREYHCSRKIHCQHCSIRVRGKGWTEYYHAMLAARLVAPGHDKVLPLEPEFVVSKGRSGDRRIARAWRPSAGWPTTASANRHSVRPSSATICSLGIRSCHAGAGCRRAFRLRLQAVVASADPGLPHRYRTARGRLYGQTRQAAPHPIATAGCTTCHCATAATR